MKNRFKITFCFAVLVFSFSACSDDGDDELKPAVSASTTTGDGGVTKISYTVIDTDAPGDSKLSGGVAGLDATEIAYNYNDETDRLTFRVTVNDLASYSDSPSIDLNFELPNGTDNKIPAATSPYTGTLKTHKTVNVYTDDGGAAPSRYTYANASDRAVNGITFTNDLIGFSAKTICDKCVDLELDVANNWIICSFDRDKVITDTEVGPTKTATIKMSSGVGYKRRNTDTVTNGDSFTITIK